MDLEAAERNRNVFLFAFLASMLAIFVGRSELAPETVGFVRLVVVLFAMVATWRFARSIGMSTLATGANTVLAALIMLIPLFVLLHYHRRFVAEATVPAPA